MRALDLSAAEICFALFSCAQCGVLLLQRRQVLGGLSNGRERSGKVASIQDLPSADWFDYLLFDRVRAYVFDVLPSGFDLASFSGLHLLHLPSQVHHLLLLPLLLLLRLRRILRREG